MRQTQTKLGSYLFHEHTTNKGMKFRTARIFYFISCYFFVVHVPIRLWLMEMINCGGLSILLNFVVNCCLS